jgi:hypothetical protein
VVHPNGVLNLSNNTTIRPVSICEGPWDGIEVTLGGEFNFTEGTVLFNN